MPNEIEAKILKTVDTALRQMLALDAEIGKVTSKLDKGECDPAKIEKLHKKVLGFLKSFSAITKMQGMAGFDKLDPKVQAKVVWLDSVMARMLKEADRLAWARKVAKFDPEKETAKLVKALKESQAQWQFKGIGTQVKQIEKGVESKNPGVTFLPMAVILFVIAMAIREMMKRKP